MKNSKTLIFLFVLGALLTFVPSLSPGDIGKRATNAEAAPASGITIVSQQCISADRVSMTFSWTSSGDGQQWLDLSIFNNGFAPNTFVGLGPLAAGANSVTWDGILAGTTHYLRVNTRVGSTWQPSSTVFFTTQSCTGFAGARALTLVSQECLPDGRVRINVSWDSSGQGVQWVDLSLFNNGFAPGSFIGQGPLPSGQESFTWDGLLPGYTHFLRVNTNTGGGWLASNTLAFMTTSTCVEAAATNLRVASQSCQADGRVTVQFAWNHSALATSQWFDISDKNDNFTTFFFGFGPLSGSQNSLGIPHLEDNDRYYVRVNTFTGYGWAPSQTLVFDTRDCETDQAGLTLQKDCLPADLEGDPFTIRVLDEEDDIVHEVELDCGESSAEVLLERGVEYTVVETDPVSGSDVRYHGKCDGDGTLSFDADDPSGTCVVSNVLEASLRIEKECDPVGLSGGPFTVRVLNPDDSVEAEVEVACGATSAVITLDAGVEYTVIETDPATGTDVSYRGQCDGDGTLTFTADDLEGTCVVRNEEEP